jgi:hypothetical protein
MTIDVALYVVYLSQILVLSFYVPLRVLRRARGLIDAYPPSEYPKLYPMSVATIERMLRLYRNWNAGFFVLGLVLLAAAWFYGYTIDPAWQNGDVSVPNPYPTAWVYTVVQMLPTAFLSMAELRYFKQMRAAAHSRIRTAELKARRWSDFVSPAAVGTAVATYIGVVALIVVAEPPPKIMPALGISRSAFMIAVLTACNLVVAGSLLWVLYGKKQDPHQTHEDRARMLRAVSQQALTASIALSAFFGIVVALVELRLMHYAPFGVSLFAQVFTVIMTGKFLLVVPFGQESFEVYRANPHRRPA